ncbi:MAG: hypothetical protein HY216_07300 [Candidatus Rokubacteria bacterium]|nr:hypothetical protein [Candidatus Rokubacteria bacterium]
MSTRNARHFRFFSCDKVAVASRVVTSTHRFALPANYRKRAARSDNFNEEGARMNRSQGSFLSRFATGLFLLTVVVIAAATPAAAQITPFFDPLTAPSTNLEPFGSEYQYGPGGLTRVSSAFGEGTTNAAFFNEPTDSFYFRIHNNLAGNRVDGALNSGQNGLTTFSTIGTYNPAGTTFEIVCFGNQVSFSIVGQPLSYTVSVAAVPGLTSSNSHLFFGNTAVGSTFSNFSVAALTPPLPTSADQCKNGGWRAFGVFKNQGDCVSFVATGGKNPPAGSR